MLDSRHPASAAAVVNDITTGEGPDRRLTLRQELRAGGEVSVGVESNRSC